ncbi:MAG: PIN domain-containing protein [Victivallales bacterium]|jgi:PIN domain nuclease of toxin-antitoxin system
MIYLDTHVVIWLYAGEIDKFPARVIEIFEREEMLISPIVLLEIKYLGEIKKINAEPALVFENLASSVNLKLCNLPFMRIITESIQQNWTRDPFDRIITATAIAQKALLVTKDRTILDNYSKAIWK